MIDTYCALCDDRDGLLVHAEYRAYSWYREIPQWVYVCHHHAGDVVDPEPVYNGAEKLSGSQYGWGFR